MSSPDGTFCWQEVQSLEGWVSHGEPVANSFRCVLTLLNLQRIIWRPSQLAALVIEMLNIFIWGQQAFSTLEFSVPILNSQPASLHTSVG